MDSYFQFIEAIPNDGSPSLINEVSFHPDGHLLAASFEYSDEVRILDAPTRATIRVLRNPAAVLNHPHGLLMTRSHILVANKADVPGRIQVFRLDDDSGTPTQSFTTPFGHLAEGHSIALHGRRLAVTYCEGARREGALVIYDFDDETGRIGDVLHIQERWFATRGDAKGVSFDVTGEHVFATFQSDFIPTRVRVMRRLKNVVSGGVRGGPSRNGLAKFAIDHRGRISRRPVWSRSYRSFCRLENIDVCDGLAVVTNPDGACVRIYDLQRDPDFAEPVQEIREGLAFPHGAKFSPDGTMLVVSDNGIACVDHVAQWRQFVSPRRDRLLLFRRRTR